MPLVMDHYLDILVYHDNEMAILRIDSSFAPVGTSKHYILSRLCVISRGLRVSRIWQP
jgi:hypothetical protein